MFRLAEFPEFPAPIAARPLPITVRKFRRGTTRDWLLAILFLPPLRLSSAPVYPFLFVLNTHGNLTERAAASRKKNAQEIVALSSPDKDRRSFPLFP